MPPTGQGTELGSYLRDRRMRLDALALGFAGRRRTPGLRREEVAQRACISATWYTWLEQGRGGAASQETLERIAKALMLTDAEREHLFLLGLGRAPDRRYRPDESTTPRLQRVLDAMETTPAILRTANWDILAWNRAAAAVLTDYATLAPSERNVLRLMFLNEAVRAAQPDWDSVARFVVAVFRADATRAGITEDTRRFVEDLGRASPEFAAMWQDRQVSDFGEGTKRLRHPVIGDLALEYSSFAVHGRPDLTILVYLPAGPDDAERIRALLDAGGGQGDRG